MVVVLSGPAHSTLLRAARLALEEKGVAHTLREADLPKAEDPRPGRGARHPPWESPVLAHEGLVLSETFAITRYVDKAFPGPALQPADARERARMTWIAGVADHHLHGPLAMRMLWWAMYGAPPPAVTADEAAATAEARAAMDRALGVIEAGLVGPAGHLAGGAFGLADCHLIPVVDLLARTPEGGAVLDRHPRLAAWWRAVETRPSVAKTRPRFG